jgi:mRNA interferase MazF
MPAHGDVWWAETETYRRPVLVVTRSQAVPVLHWIVVAPITRTIRHIPTEIELGPDDGLRDECVASFDNLRTIRRAHLVDWIGSLGPRRTEICRALSALADC